MKAVGVYATAAVRRVCGHGSYVFTSAYRLFCRAFVQASIRDSISAFDRVVNGGVDGRVLLSAARIRKHKSWFSCCFAVLKRINNSFSMFTRGSISCLIILNNVLINS